MNMEIRDFLDTVASQLVNELTPILEIKGVTENTDLLGKYTEACIRRLVHRIVHPMHVSTGAVLDHPIPIPLRQIDLIIWAPFPVPAIFEVEGFGLVPKSSVFGVIEVKRSNYSGTEEKLEGFLADVESQKIVAEYDPKLAPILDNSKSAGIGVICVLETSPSQKLKKLISESKVVAIFEKDGGKTKVRAKDVFVLVNFLQFVTWRYRKWSANTLFPQIDIDKLE
jgi:hypothetical protein